MNDISQESTIPWWKLDRLKVVKDDQRIHGISGQDCSILPRPGVQEAAGRG